MHQQKLALDHLVLGVPDLEQGAAWFEEITGVRPAFGGRHATGTANYLVGLGGDRYLEIIGILPEARGDGVA
jgi:catechol 2,3-dioxygenase-like lactoylglutathione lyase family enzyme